MSAATRREVLAAAPVAAGAVALPVAALAGTGTHDPGLAQLEAGYARWQKLSAKASRMYWRADDAWARARQKYDAQVEPEPVRPPELAQVYQVMSGSIDQVLDPNHPLTLPPDLLAMFRDHDAAWNSWLESRPSMDEAMADDRDYKQYRRIQGQALQDEAVALRNDLLEIPTTSPRGFMIKLALAASADDLDAGLSEALEHNEVVSEAWAVLLADLRRMGAAA